MYNFLKHKFFILVLIGVSVIACSKKEDNPSPSPTNCTGFTKLGSTMTVNGKSLDLISAQQIVSALGGVTFTMSIGALSADCNEMQTLNITVEEGDNQKLNGTYPIVDFFNSTENTANGAFLTQKFNPISQNLTDLKSGTVKFTDLNNKKYSMDLNATLVDGQKLTFKGDVQF